MSRAIVVKRLARSGNSPLSPGRPAAEHADRLRMFSQGLDRAGQRLRAGGALDVEKELVAPEAPAQRAGLDPGEVHLAIREHLQGVNQRAGPVLPKLGEDQ